LTASTTTRVRYPETDRMGVAHHTHHLVWFELGRTELLRGCGSSYASLEEVEGIMLPVIELGASYEGPARYDDELVIKTTLAFARGARMRFEYIVERMHDGAVLSRGFSEHACVGRDGRPRRLPESLLARLTAPVRSTP
jgi:acyl-CoA thioester hydrolase